MAGLGAPAGGPESQAPGASAAESPAAGGQRVERRAFLTAISLMVLVFGWFVLRPLFAPLMLAVLTAVIAYPMQARLESWLDGRGRLAALVSLAALTLAVGAPAVGVSMLFVAQAREVLAQILGEAESRSRLVGLAEQAAEGLSRLVRAVGGEAVAVERLSGEALETLAAGLYERIPGLFNQAGRFAFGALLLYLVLFVLLLRGRELLDALVELSPTGEEHSRRILERLHGTIKGVFLGAIATAIVQGTIGAVGLWLAGFQNQIVWGALLAAAGLVPIVGTALIWLPATLYLLLAGQTGPALWMLAIGVIVGAVDNLIKPLLIHERAEVHPVLVFIGVFGGLRSFGAMGLLYGPLLAACLTEMVRIYRDDFRPPHRSEA